MTGTELRASPEQAASGIGALVELTSALAGAETIDQLCDRALRVVERALGVERASVLLLDDDGVMRFRSWSGLSDRYRTATEGHSPWDVDTLDAEPIVVADAETDDRVAGLRATILGEKIRGLAFVPIAYERRLLGKYMLYFDAPRELSPDELRIARMVANQLAVAVKRHNDAAELRSSRDQLKTIFSGVGDAITVQAPNGELVYANEAAARSLGAANVEELLRTPISEIMSRFEAFNEDGTPLEIPQLPARKVFAGAPAAERVVRYRARGSRAERWSLVRATPLHNEDGSVQYAVNVVQDVTAQRRQQEWHRLLADASAVLAESLVSDRTLRRLADLAVPSLADWCAVYVPERDMARLAAVSHRDSKRLRLALDLVERYPPDDPELEGTAPWVLKHDRSHLIEHITDEVLVSVAVDEEHLTLLRALELGSAMIVPLSARGRTLAAMSFATSGGRASFSPDDLANAEEFARRAALSLDNALLHEAERDARMEAERSASLARRLQAVTAALSGAVTSEQVGAVIVGEGIGALGADAGAVFLVDEGESQLELVAQVGYAEELAARHAPAPLGTPGPTTEAVATGEIVVLESGEALVERWPHYHEAQELTGDEATIAAPLVLGGRPRGAFYVAFRAPRSFAEWELDLVRTLAGQCSQALERAKLYEQEHEVAITLQRSLLPRRLPARDSLRLGAIYRPGKQGLNVGGDWYDAFELPDGRIAFAVGDVVGRGLEAATVMVELRNAKRPYFLEGVPPDQTLSRLNAFALHAADISSTGRAFATVLAGMIDVAARTVSMSSAGHPPPLVVQPSGEASFVDIVSGPPIGAVDDPTYRLVELTLEPGSTMILYTDGLVERRDRSLSAGLEELLQTVQAADADLSLDALSRHVVDSMVGDEVADDVAVLVARLLRTPTMRRRLRARTSELAPLRRDLRAWLGDIEADEDARYDLTLAASEACANAIEHPVGRRDRHIDVEARQVEDRIELTIRDTGGWREPDPETLRGRGLTLIGSLMDDVAIERTADGTELRMTRRLTEKRA